VFGYEKFAKKVAVIFCDLTCRALLWQAPFVQVSMTIDFELCNYLTILYVLGFPRRPVQMFDSD